MNGTFSASEWATVHADYPHNPGTLYDCPACERYCYCKELGYTAQCVACAIRAEEARAETVALFDVTATLHGPGCPGCQDQAEEAAIMARATGAVSARAVTGSPHPLHWAEATRKPKG